MFLSLIGVGFYSLTTSWSPMGLCRKQLIPNGGIKASPGEEKDVYYSNFNTACLRDKFFHSLRLTQLADAIFVHNLISFVDAYSRYNKNSMYGLGKEHASFLTKLVMCCYKVLLLALHLRSSLTSKA